MCIYSLSGYQNKKETMEIFDYVKYMVDRVGIKEAIGNKTEEDLNKCLNIDDFLSSFFRTAATASAPEHFL